MFRPSGLIWRSRGGHRGESCSPTRGHREHVAGEVVVVEVEVAYEQVAWVIGPIWSKVSDRRALVRNTSVCPLWTSMLRQPFGFADVAFGDLDSDGDDEMVAVAPSLQNYGSKERHRELTIVGLSECSP